MEHTPLTRNQRVTVWLDPVMYTRVVYLGQSLGTNHSVIVRAALKDFFQKIEKDSNETLVNIIKRADVLFNDDFKTSKEGNKERRNLGEIVRKRIKERKEGASAI